MAIRPAGFDADVAHPMCTNLGMCRIGVVREVDGNKAPRDFVQSDRRWEILGSDAGHALPLSRENTLGRSIRLSVDGHSLQVYRVGRNEATLGPFLAEASKQTLAWRDRLHGASHADLDEKESADSLDRCLRFGSVRSDIPNARLSDSVVSQRNHFTLV